LLNRTQVIQNTRKHPSNREEEKKGRTPKSSVSSDSIQRRRNKWGEGKHTPSRRGRVGEKASQGPETKNGTKPNKRPST